MLVVDDPVFRMLVVEVSLPPCPGPPPSLAVLVLRVVVIEAPDDVESELVVVERPGPLAKSVSAKFEAPIVELFDMESTLLTLTCEVDVLASGEEITRTPTENKSIMIVRVDKLRALIVRAISIRTLARETC